MNLTMHWNKLGFFLCAEDSTGFWNSKEDFCYPELWLWLIFPHLPWLWWTALCLISWSAATNIRVISQPHSAKRCTAFHFIFLQQQWCISLLHMFSLIALICHCLVPVGMCMYMHWTSHSRKHVCLTHGCKFASSMATVKWFVLPTLAGSVHAHLMCKSGPVLVCHSNGDAAMLGLRCSGKNSFCVPAFRNGLICKVFQAKPWCHVVIKLVTVYWLIMAIFSVAGSQEPVTEQFLICPGSDGYPACSKKYTSVGHQRVILHPYGRAFPSQAFWVAFFSHAIALQKR